MLIIEKIKWAAKNSVNIYRDVTATFSSGYNCFDWTEVDSVRKPIRGISIYKLTGKRGIRYAYEAWTIDSDGEHHRECLTFSEKLSINDICNTLMIISDKK
jgi:hypothetical protein